MVGDEDDTEKKNGTECCFRLYDACRESFHAFAVCRKKEVDHDRDGENLCDCSVLRITEHDREVEFIHTGEEQCGKEENRHDDAGNKTGNTVFMLNKKIVHIRIIPLNQEVSS